MANLPDIGVAPSGEYPDMPRSVRLEFGPKPGAILGHLFISEVLNRQTDGKSGAMSYFAVNSNGAVVF